MTTSARAPSGDSPGFCGAAVALALLLIVTSTLVGWSTAAPSAVLQGPPEQGEGADVGESTPGYWLWQATQVWHVPNPVPPLLSSNPLLPTVLPGTAASDTLNPATAGNSSVRWTFSETTTVSPSKELELRFTDGLARPATLVTVYLETQLFPPLAPLAYTLYWDAGPFGPTGITVETMQVDVLVCTSIGVCP
ncbi:MAG: hypothetical protein L3K10_08390 [Thermoplasmata archaeon]|nr:hypothetical protein [Thermoplasmata archaeon]